MLSFLELTSTIYMRVLIILVNTQKLFLLINNRKINCKTMTTLQNNYDKLKNLISNQISTFLWDCILNHRNHHHYPSRHFCFPTVPNILNDVFQCQQIHSSSDSLHFHWHVVSSFAQSSQSSGNVLFVGSTLSAPLLLGSLSPHSP